MATQTTATLLEELRQRIEDEYRDALAAWEKMKRYAEGNGAATLNEISVPKVSPPPAIRSFHNGSNKRRVLSFLKSDPTPATVDEIVAATGLNKRQVRGVLYAKDIQRMIEGVKLGSVMRFGYKSPSKEDVNAA